LFKGSLELLWVDNSTEVTVEDVEGGLDVLNLFNGDGQGCVVLGLPGFFLRSLGLGLSGSWCGGFGLHLD
jgi:hypothetical protein